jgi:hypothetical protein
MLSFSGDEYWADDQEDVLEVAPALEGINQWLSSSEHEYGALTDLTAGAGGVGMCAHLFGGGYKHFEIEAFIDAVWSQPWQDINSGELFLKGEESDTWTVLHHPDAEQ